MTANGAVLDHLHRAESGINQDAEKFPAVRALDLDIIDAIHSGLRIDFHLFRVAPQTLEVVEAASGFEEDVANDIAVIDHDPLARGEAIGRSGSAVDFIAGFFTDGGGDGFELWLGGTGADQKEVGEIRDSPHVQKNDVSRLFVCRCGGAEVGCFFRVAHSGRARVAG